MGCLGDSAAQERLPSATLNTAHRTGDVRGLQFEAQTQARGGVMDPLRQLAGTGDAEPLDMVNRLSASSPAR